MAINFEHLFSQKSNEELLEIAQNYNKYTEEALSVLLKEIDSRDLELPNKESIINHLSALAQSKPKKKKITEEDLHPNIKRASNVILLGIPLIIIQFIVAIYLINEQQINADFFDIMKRGLSAGFIISILIDYLLSVWIKRGTNLSRIVISTLAVLSIFSDSTSLYHTSTEDYISRTFYFIYIMIGIYLLYLLLNRDTSEWYKDATKD